MTSWKEVEAKLSTIAKGWFWSIYFFFPFRIRRGRCFCKGCVRENERKEYTAAWAISEISSSFSEESRRACPFHWAPCEYFLIKKWIYRTVYFDVNKTNCMNNYIGIKSLQRLLKGGNNVWSTECCRSCSNLELDLTWGNKTLGAYYA